jgi:hypothetical protein
MGWLVWVPTSPAHRFSPNLGKPYLEVKGQANVDPRITGRIQTYLTNWYSWGAAMGPLNYFVAGATNLIDQYGSYGILQDMRMQDSNKAKGVDAVRLKPLPKTPTGKHGIPSVPFVVRAVCSGAVRGACRVWCVPCMVCAVCGACRV